MNSEDSVEVLITTMNCNNFEELLKKMNIQTNAMIGNQTSYNEIKLFHYNDKQIKSYSFQEKGVGLNRNNLLMRTTADYCLFGDDDLIYAEGYENIVKEAFCKYPDADVIIFNLEEEVKRRYIIEEDFKVNYLNFMRFGAARIAIKTDSILLNGILFNTCFGGGTDHNNGEDTLFLCECLKHHLKIYAVATMIAYLPEGRESTWFKGYDEKYFEDKGLLYYVISKHFYKFLCFQDSFRHKKLYSDDLTSIEILKKMLNFKKK